MHILDWQSLEDLCRGRGGSGDYAVHMATDSKGNLYTTETYEGKRAEKFNYKGVAATAAEQGVLWPARPKRSRRRAASALGSRSAARQLSARG